MDLPVYVLNPTDPAQIVVRRRANGYGQAQARFPRTFTPVDRNPTPFKSRLRGGGRRQPRTDLLLRWTRRGTECLEFAHCEL